MKKKPKISYQLDTIPSLKEPDITLYSESSSIGQDYTQPSLLTPESMVMLNAMLTMIVSHVMLKHVQNVPAITFKEKNVLKNVTRDISYKVLNA